jgi:hypothetical protein
MNRCSPMVMVVSSLARGTLLISEYKIPHHITKPQSPTGRDYELVFTIIVTFTTFDEGIFFRSNSEILQISF